MAHQMFIFDFDGTIADTLHHLIKISNRLSTEYGFRAIAPEDIDILKDMNSLQIIHHLRIPMIKVPALAARIKKELSRDITAVPAADGLLKSLQNLKSGGHQLGILSSNSQANVSVFLKHHRFDVFDFVHTTTTIWNKNIQLSRLIADRQLKKESVWYIGDEIRDVVAAKKAGVKSVAVGWGYNSARSLQQAGADQVLEHPAELGKLLKVG